MIFNHAGESVAIHQLEHEQIYPKPGWVEHDPLEIWTRTKDVIEGALQKSPPLPATLPRWASPTSARQRSCGIGRPASPTTTPWSGKIRARTRSAVNWPRMAVKLASSAKVGLPLATYFSGPKVKWLLDNVDGLRAAAERGDAIFGNTDTWVIWNLTGGPNGGYHVTDVSNASRTMLMDLDGTQWDDEILKIMTIPRSMLPEIRPSSDPALLWVHSSGWPFWRSPPRLRRSGRPTSGHGGSNLL